MATDDRDLHADFSALWADSTVIHQRSHGVRTLKVGRSAPMEGILPSFLCVITDVDRFEGRLTLSPEGSVPRVAGVLINRDHESYRVQRDAFIGGPLELVDLACQLLDYEYKFPPEAEITADNFVWTTKPPPFRPGEK